MRQILNLAGMENLSYEQIADILDVPLGTVRSRSVTGPRGAAAAHGSARPCCPSARLAPATRSRAAIPGRVPIPAGRVPRCAGGRPGWPRGGMAPRPATGSATVDPAPGAPGWPVARHRWRRGGHDGATPPDCGSRITARLPSTARKPLPPCIRSGTGRPTPPVFIPWRGHGVAERRVRHRHDIRGRRHRDAVNGHQPGPDQEQPLAPLHGLGFAGEQGPRNGMSPSSGTCRPSRYSGCCCTRLSAGSDPHDGQRADIALAHGRQAIDLHLALDAAVLDHGQLNLPALGGAI